MTSSKLIWNSLYHAAWIYSYTRPGHISSLQFWNVVYIFDRRMNRYDFTLMGNITFFIRMNYFPMNRSFRMHACLQKLEIGTPFLYITLCIGLKTRTILFYKSWSGISNNTTILNCIHLLLRCVLDLHMVWAEAAAHAAMITHLLKLLTSVHNSAYNCDF